MLQDRDLALQPLTVRAGRRNLEDESSTVVGSKLEVVIGESDQGFGADMESPCLGGEAFRLICGELAGGFHQSTIPDGNGWKFIIREILLG